MSKEKKKFSLLMACFLFAATGFIVVPAFGQDDETFQINPGLNGAWFNPLTAGQGFFLDVLPDTDLVFISWFTYDTNQPDSELQAVVGNPGHRWLTAQGPIEGDTATLEVFMSSGGLFDDSAPVSNQADGTITLSFEDCATGTIGYELTASGLSGSVPISRLAGDNVELCETMDGLSTAVSESTTQIFAMQNKRKSFPLENTIDEVDQCPINPGHNGAWFNAETAGQGFFLDVLPATDLVFMSWFTYDNTQPGPKLQAVVGDPGHRWLTAQGPIEGDTGTLEVFISSGGLFDDPAAVSNAPEGSMTVTFESCTKGLVEYEFTGAGLSGSVPIARLAPDNVAHCESLCKALVPETENARQTIVGREGGILNAADNQGNIITLKVPELGLISTTDTIVESVPLSPLSRLPTGQNVLAGVNWTLSPGDLGLPVALEFLTPEAARYEDLAAFVVSPDEKGTYFLPLLLEESAGAVLQVLDAPPGAAGLVATSADEMEALEAPEVPAEARYMHDLAVIVKKAVESGELSLSAKPSNGSERVHLPAGADARARVDDVLDEILTNLLGWFDAIIEPRLNPISQNCEFAQGLVDAGAQWTQFVLRAGLEDHPQLSQRISRLANTIADLDFNTDEDFRAFDNQCKAEKDPCKKMKIMQEAHLCYQTLQRAGVESSLDNLVCEDAPVRLEIAPNVFDACISETIQFTAQVSNAKGSSVGIEAGELHWTSNNSSALSIDSKSGAAQTLDFGNVFVEVESTVCGEQLHGTAFIEVAVVPEIIGNYRVTGTETVSGCEFPEDNGTFDGAGTATIIVQADHPESSPDTFSGIGVGLGIGEVFDGTISCGGAIQGSGTYSESSACGDDICITNGTSTFSGELIGPVIRLDTTAADVSGDTCTAKGRAIAKKR